MNLDFQEILKELEFRVPKGIIDLTKEEQVTELVNILRENGISDANQYAQRARVIFGFVTEADDPLSKADKALNQTVINKDTNNPVLVSTALSYKNKKGKGAQKAYQDAKAIVAKAGASPEEIEKLTGEKQKGDKKEKPVASTIKVSDAETRAAEKEKSKKKEEEPRMDPTVGETVKEVSPKEIDDIISKYVSAGEKTPDQMRDMVSKYSKQDMAEGYSDEDYYSESNGGRGHKTAVREEPYKIDNKTRKQLQDNGFPEKYIKFIERCINTQVKGKKPPVTDLIKQGGAGQIQSQFGEVMAMAFMSIRDKNVRRQLADVVNSEIKKSAEEFGGGKASPIATSDWVEASLTHAESFDSTMDEKYGRGQWRFEGASWDIREDVESLGLDYKNKGFSTDVMLRVQPLKKNGENNGPALAQKCSLKKDEAIFFFNGSINEVNNFVLNFIPEKDRKLVKGYEAIVTKSKSKNKEEKAAAIAAAQRITGLPGGKAIQQLKESAEGLRNQAFQSAPKDVQNAITEVREFGQNQLSSAINLTKKVKTDIRNVNSVIDNAADIDAADKEFAKMSYEIVKKCKGSKDTELCIRQKLKSKGEETGDDRVCKVSVMAAKISAAAGDKAADKALSAHYDIATNAGNALMSILPDSPQLMGGLMQKLAEAFPMKTCMDGEEFMLIDGMKVTQKTLQTVFGVESYEELQQGLKLKKMPNGEVVLVYGAKTKSGKDIPVGLVKARQKGKGYEGTVGFEIACNDDFAFAIAAANDKNGDKSESNKKALERIGSRLSKREQKKNKA